MVNLNILNHHRKLPTKLNEISLMDGIPIMEMLVNEPTLALKMSIISLLSNIDIDLIVEFEDESIERIWSLFDFTKPEVGIFLPDTFYYKGKYYGITNFSKMTVREYGDIEFWIDQGETPFSCLHKILAIIYRPIIVKKRTLVNVLMNIISRIFIRGVIPVRFKSYKIEPLTEEHAEIADDFLQDMDFSFGYGILLKIDKFNKDLKEGYPILFRTEEQEEEIKNTEGEDQSFISMWGMYGVLMSISDSIFERDEWLKKPIKEFYKLLSFLKQKSIYDGRNN